MGKKIEAPEPPRGQYKGPIVPGPAGVSTCRPCSQLFGERVTVALPDGRRIKAIRDVGVPNKHRRQHDRDHKLGRIKKVAS